MDRREPNLVHSGLSRTVTKDGVTVEVSIVRLENETEWSLEVVNSSAEFERTVAEEGIRTFLDEGKVIPFRRWEQWDGVRSSRLALPGNFMHSKEIYELEATSRVLMDDPRVGLPLSHGMEYAV
jgi:hypothetical protein